MNMVRTLLKVMAENNRLVALPAVFEAFAQLKAEYEKEATVDVVSATVLDCGSASETDCRPCHNV